ncbi:MAG: metallophosphoesterase [Thermoplasmatales archaeon]
MASFLCIGDLHIKLSNIDIIRQVKKELIKVIQKKSPNYVVLLGDMHDSFEKIHMQVWNEIIDFINDLTKVSTQVYYIVGNHDMLNNQVFLSKDHFFNAFKNWNGNPIIVDSPTILPLGNKWVGFLPYVPPGRFGEAIEALMPTGKPYGKCAAIFAHQEFHGISFGPVLSEKGDKYPESYPLVISGHIHEYQWFRKNILYVGSPYQTNFGEMDDKSVSLITIGDSIIEERIRLDVPKNTIIEATRQEFEEISINDFDKFKIIISGSMEDILAIKKTKKFKELGDNVKVIFRTNDKPIVKKNINNLAFLELLKIEVDKESEAVKEIFSEVLREINT